MRINDSEYSMALLPAGRPALLVTSLQLLTGSIHGSVTRLASEWKARRRWTDQSHHHYYQAAQSLFNHKTSEKGSLIYILFLGGVCSMRLVGWRAMNWFVVVVYTNSVGFQLEMAIRNSSCQAVFSSNTINTIRRPRPTSTRSTFGCFSFYYIVAIGLKFGWKSWIGPFPSLIDCFFICLNKNFVWRDYTDYKTIFERIKIDVTIPRLLQISDSKRMNRYIIKRKSSACRSR